MQHPIVMSIFLTMHYFTILLGENDFPNVLRSVVGILPLWEDLGMALGLDMAELSVIEEDKATSKARMKAVLLVWLQGRGLDRNWQTLCKALRDELVDRADLAKRIERDFL